MPTNSYHHLYDIHILVIIPRRVVDVFGPCSLSLSLLCLPFAFSCPCYLTILLSHRVGPSTAVSRRAAHVLRLFPCPARIYLIVYLYHLNSLF
ncbi:hypothetical protein BJ322DRAFT_584112 [Thelephora terrestris]|uniref:Uncharacterized protein n=1 Tax=Thelephora terrestris TaxID=56493 RepID=A0A9P6HJT8_9AGAM|nr:hypothetical protein BJ322DRAFT_584112 [Thelephora terrestris]